MERTYSVCCGVDVGKSSHHFAAIIPATGELVFDGKVEQSESGIRDALLSVSLFGSPVVVVDQPGNMAALLFAVCDDMGIAKGFITPRAMSQAIEMYGGDIKTDAHDALVIAEVSSSLPKLVKPVSEKSALYLRLSALMSYDRELTLEAHLEGKRVQSNFSLMVLSRYGGPAGLKKAGRGNVRRWLGSRKGMGEAALRRLDDLFEAIGRQSVTIAGSEYVEELIKQEASFLLTVLASRKKVAESRDELLSQMPEARLLMSLPGLGAVTCATFLAEVGDVSRFPNASKLASYAGLAPKVRQSGKTIHSVTKPRGGNRRLKRVLVLSAGKSVQFCEESRAYYERKRSEGHSYGSCMMALARRRLNVMYAMLRDGTAYEKQNG